MYYRVKSTTLAAKIEAWMEKRQEAIDAFMRLSRRVGASRNRYGSSDNFGGRVFLFVFNREPDRKHWKQSHEGYWSPKLSSKVGKAIADEVQAIQNKDSQREHLSQLFGINNFWHHVGIQLVGTQWVVNFKEEWKFSTLGLKRISDVQLEKLIAIEEK